jgi:hypothetical protein
MIDYAAAKFWIDAAQILVTALISIYLWYDRRDRATRGAVHDACDKIEALGDDTAEKIDALGSRVDARLAGHEARITTVEACVENAPKHADLAAIYDRINAIGSKVDEMSGELRGFRRGIDLIQQHLMGDG